MCNTPYQKYFPTQSGGYWYWKDSLDCVHGPFDSVDAANDDITLALHIERTDSVDILDPEFDELW